VQAVDTPGLFGYMHHSDAEMKEKGLVNVDERVVRKDGRSI
jgi:hypothetical protein